MVACFSYQKGKNMQKFSVSSEYFSIYQSITCGQVFRYKQISKNAFEIISRDKICYLSQNDDIVTIESDDIEYFKNYFDLSTDYKKITTSLSVFEELKEKVEYGKGIRIFRQDTYETVISFIISANNNIKRIQKIIEKLCERVGEKKNGFYAFPTAKQLQSLSVGDFKDLGLGYRAQYLYDTCRVIDDMIDIIKSQDTEQATKSLLSLKGVGPKVANCILLFGLYKTNSYPVDTWIFKANKTEELNTEKKVLEYYQNRYGEYAGYAQQYVFFYAREKGLQNKEN